jgi:hypothetical protein
MDATHFLKREHNAIKRLLVDLRRAGPRAHRKRRDLLERIAADLEVHARLEDELLYPAVATLPDARHIIAEARADHEAIRDVLTEIDALDPADAAYATKTEEFREIVLGHLADEEDDVFRLAQQLGADRLAQIGNELDARRPEVIAERARSDRPTAA